MIDLGGDVTGNGIAKLVFTILSAVAEAERDRIRERISNGNVSKSRMTWRFRRMHVPRSALSLLESCFRPRRNAGHASFTTRGRVKSALLALGFVAKALTIYIDVATKYTIDITHITVTPIDIADKASSGAHLHFGDTGCRPIQPIARLCGCIAKQNVGRALKETFVELLIERVG
jgi:hypothetical protein